MLLGWTRATSIDDECDDLSKHLKYRIKKKDSEETKKRELMSSASIYEKLSAVANKQTAVTSRQELLEAITGMGAIALDSDWQDVPVIYSNTKYNNIAKQVADQLKTRNQQVAPETVQLSIDTAVNTLNSIVTKKSSQKTALQTIVDTLNSYIAQTIDRVSADAQISQAFSAYIDDTALTLNPITSTSGTTTPVSVTNSPLESTMYFSLTTDIERDGNLLPAGISYPVLATDQSAAQLSQFFTANVQSINSLVAILQSRITNLQSIRSDVTDTLQRDTVVFNTLKKSVTDQLTEKLGAVSRSIEFYDAVVKS